MDHFVKAVLDNQEVELNLMTLTPYSHECLLFLNAREITPQNVYTCLLKKIIEISKNFTSLNCNFLYIRKASKFIVKVVTLFRTVPN